MPALKDSLTENSDSSTAIVIFSDISILSVYYSLMVSSVDLLVVKP